jgi:AcrR family transcriptional regulator/RimJ/RimL family protein N-acetyltransferase
VTTDDAKRDRILQAASELFTAQGYGGTTVGMVARRARLAPQTVRRLVGGRRELLVGVLAVRDRSEVADLVQRAAEAPASIPPLSVLIEAAHRLHASPRSTWDSLELEVLARAADDPVLRAIGAEPVARRSANARAVTEHSRRAGGIDPELSDSAFVQMLMALSIGLAMLDPVAGDQPTPEQWDALMARIGAAVAPEEMLLQPEYDVSNHWYVRVDVPDRPGGLARMVRALGALHVHTAALQVVGYEPGTRTIDLAIVAPQHVSRDVILAAARSVGERAYITTGSPEDRRDLFARMLDAATHLVKHPEGAPRMAADLVGADSFEVIAAPEGVDDRTDVLRLQWTADRHVLLHRSWAPFTRIEQARASALLRLSTAIARSAGDDDSAGWIETVRGGTVWIRLARPEDADKVAGMHDRCSDRSRYQRYFSHAEWRDIRLRRLAGGHRGATLVAMSRDGDIVGLGNVFPAADPATAEIGILVEDAFQGSGVGTVLLARMLEVARRLGFSRVEADVLADNAGMRRLLDRAGLAWTTTVSDSVARMTADLLAPEG